MPSRTPFLLNASWETTSPYTWALTQKYVSEDSGVLLTRAEHAGLGITVHQYAHVLPGKDVLVHRFVLERTADSPVENLSLIYYENFAPCLQKQEMVPLGCWSNDAQNDFAVLYDSRRDALIHFLPEQADYTPLEPLVSGGALPTQEVVDAWIEEIDKTFGSGIYTAVGGDTDSTGHQCGADSQTRCKTERFPRPEDAFPDALDGSLSGSSVAACQANAALAFPLEFDVDGRAEASVYVAFSNTADAAFSLLQETRKIPAVEHMEITDRWWGDWIGRAILPRSDDPALRAFSKRALITLKIYSDRDSGATVDSIQPPWQVWPLDAGDHAFALDLAGYHDMAEKENLFLSRVQRKEEGSLPFGPFPAGSLAEAYYADGTLAAPIPFILSWTSRTVWSWWTHAQFIEDSCDRRMYLQRVYLSIRPAAEMLAACKDESNNLPCPASCSETFEPSQSLWDAAGVHLALDSAVQAGRLMGEGEAVLGRWRERAEELQEAILSSGDRGDEECELWWGWPSRVRPSDDSSAQKLMDVLWRKVEPGIAKEADVTGIFYSGGHLTALARAWRGDPEKMERLDRALRVFTVEAPTPGTLHLGDDLLIVTDGGGERRYLNVTSTPNAFSSTNVFIAAMAFHNPERFDALDEPVTQAECAGGCSCRAVGAVSGAPPVLDAGGALAGLFLLVAFFVVARRPPRKARPSGVSP
ncbi:MAG: hypothetical protein HYY13_00060 [Nitrospirae bacterium]|nr:hypothetical protein [Nitrospirota bacterium]